MIPNGQTDLLELIQCACEMSEGLVRMDAVRRLKKCSIQRLDALALSEFARKAEDPAWRTTAAQVLGYHRVAARYTDLIEPLKGAAATEKDPETRRALVYAIRGTDGVTDLVDHPLADVALEAVVGVPESEPSWCALLDGYFRGLPPEQEARVLKLVGRLATAATWVVDYLLQSPFDDVAQDPSERVVALFQHMDQGVALTTLLEAQESLERTHTKIWPGLARRERKRVLLDLLAAAVRGAGPDPSLAEELSDCVRKQSGYVEANGRALRGLFRELTGRDGEQLILVIAHVFDGATRKEKLQLAELMMLVAKELPDSTETVLKILSVWPDAPPEMLLKLRQSRMGIR